MSWASKWAFAVGAKLRPINFRSLFLSMHRDSSSSWSLMFTADYRRPITEAIGFHGCETWELPKSLGSYILPFLRYPNHHTLDYFYRGTSNGLILIESFVDRIDYMDYSHKSFVGNPVLQQWVEIPKPPEQCFATGLITRVDENGLVSSFKVIWTEPKEREINVWRVYVYSSETGLWTFKRLLCSLPDYLVIMYYPPVNLNGKYNLWERESVPTEYGVVLAHDFYDPEEAEDQCRVIPLPVSRNKHVKRCLTTSGGHVIYIELLSGRLKVWKLNDNNKYENSEWWQLSWEINICNRFLTSCFTCNLFVTY